MQVPWYSLQNNIHKLEVGFFMMVLLDKQNSIVLAQYCLFMSSDSCWLANCVAIARNLWCAWSTAKKLAVAIPS